MQYEVKDQSAVEKMAKKVLGAFFDAVKKVIDRFSAKKAQSARMVPGTFFNRNWKRVLGIVMLAAIGLLSILIYWNSHLYYRALKTEDEGEKIRLLEKAGRVYSLNELVYHELGKLYFERGVKNLNDVVQMAGNIQRAVRSYERSIRLDPASKYTHFNYAQAVQYMGYIPESSRSDAAGGSGDASMGASLYSEVFEEYRKAALLAGHNSQIYFEVGRIFLSQWSVLSEEDKEFALDFLRRVMERKDSARLRSLMYNWEMNVKDYDVIDAVIPEDIQMYRMYAKFLGEKSLSREERQRYLAKVDFLEFERAKNEYSLGENAFLYLKVKDAFKYYQSFVNGIGRIRFYQDLTGEKQIDDAGLDEMLKSAYLKLAKCRIAEGRPLSEVEGYLRKYLEMEKSTSVCGELESYLRKRGLIKEKLGAEFDDLGQLAFEALLYFKQSRYREIMRVWELMEKSFVVVPDENKKDYVEFLMIVGNSYQKVDFIYNAEEVYKQALEIEPKNLNVLLRLRVNYERLNEEKNLREVNKKIDGILSLREDAVRRPLIRKGRTFSKDLVLDGKDAVLELHFKGDWEEGKVRIGARGAEMERGVRSDEAGAREAVGFVDDAKTKGSIAVVANKDAIWMAAETAPLITIVFNGRVVWEDYLKDENGVVSVRLDTKIGSNRLTVTPLSRDVELVSLNWDAVSSM